VKVVQRKGGCVNAIISNIDEQTENICVVGFVSPVAKVADKLT
jgi:hypothetical protein